MVSYCFHLPITFQLRRHNLGEKSRALKATSSKHNKAISVSKRSKKELRAKLLKCGKDLMDLEDFHGREKNFIFSKIAGDSLKISIENFKNFANRYKICGNSVNERAKAFELLDLDGCHQLTVEEFKNLFVTEEERHAIGFALFKQFNDKTSVGQIFDGLKNRNSFVTAHQVLSHLPSEIEEDFAFEEVFYQMSRGSREGLDLVHFGEFFDIEIKKFFLGNMIFDAYKPPSLEKVAPGASLLQAFTVLDKDLDGIEAHELHDNDLTKGLASDLDFFYLVGHLDKDGSGALDLEEFEEIFFAKKFVQVLGNKILNSSDRNVSHAEDSQAKYAAVKRGDKFVTFDDVKRAAGIDDEWTVPAENGTLSPHVGLLHLFFFIDKDGDKNIQLEEFENFVIEPKRVRNLGAALQDLFSIQRPHELFARLDRDQSGVLDSDEILEEISKELEVFFDHADVNQMDYLTEDEFVQALESGTGH